VDDERVVNRLRQVADPASPDPAFLERMYEELAEELRFRPARQGAVRPARSGMARRLTLLAAAAVLTLLMVGGALVIGAIVDRERRPDATPALLERIREAGVIRIAIRPDRPQVTPPSGAPSGFDGDAATEIGRRLDLRVELEFTPADEILAGGGAWDIALPSSAVEPGTFATTTPYYAWPVQLLVRAGSTAAGPGDLSGSTICVVTGSGGEAWLDGRFRGTSVTPVAVRPTPLAVHRLATDDACAADVTADASAALVTAAWSDADLVARPALKRLGGPIFTEARPVIAVRGERDPAGLIAEIDRILADMRSDGTLADFSRSRFGGLDLSQSTRP
jgi:ABC-type amino acid transport substrate-binding protein